MDLHELWHSVMNACLFTEVKQQQAMLVLGWVIALVHYFCMALWLPLIDQNIKPQTSPDELNILDSYGACETKI